MIPLPNPFETMGSIAGKIVVEGWTAAMLAVWNAGLWVLRLVLNWVDALLTDIALSLAYSAYGYLFHWAFDRLRPVHRSAG